MRELAQKNITRHNPGWLAVFIALPKAADIGTVAMADGGAAAAALPRPLRSISPSNTRQLLSAELAETKRTLQRRWDDRGAPPVSAAGEAAGAVDGDEWPAQLARLERGEQPPWHAWLHEFVIPDSDPRIGLRTQRGVRVRRPAAEHAAGNADAAEVAAAAVIPAGAVLVHYSGTVRTQEEYDAVYADRLANGYVFLMWRRAADAAASGGPPGPSALLLDAWDGGNTGCMVNDYRENPLGDCATVELLRQERASAPESTGGPATGSRRSRNVQFVRVHDRGWPHMFIVAVRDLIEGEELLLDYGEPYWECRRKAQLSPRPAVAPTHTGTAAPG
jgi:hypothetical protein